MNTEISYPLSIIKTKENPRNCYNYCKRVKFFPKQFSFSHLLKHNTRSTEGVNKRKNQPIRLKIAEWSLERIAGRFSIVLSVTRGRMHATPCREKVKGDTVQKDGTRVRVSKEGGSARCTFDVCPSYASAFEQPTQWKTSRRQWRTRKKRRTACMCRDYFPSPPSPPHVPLFPDLLFSPLSFFRLAVQKLRIILCRVFSLPRNSSPLSLLPLGALNELNVAFSPRMCNVHTAFHIFIVVKSAASALRKS